MVILYWSLAFIVAAAIPQVQTISGLVAAVCIMQVKLPHLPPVVLETDMDGLRPVHVHFPADPHLRILRPAGRPPRGRHVLA